MQAVLLTIEYALFVLFMYILAFVENPLTEFICKLMKKTGIQKGINSNYHNCRKLLQQLIPVICQTSLVYQKSKTKKLSKT